MFPLRYNIFTHPLILLTRSLYFGGTERQMIELAIGLHTAGNNVTVVTFYPGGELEKDLLAAGVPLISLNKKGRWDVLPFFIRLCRFMQINRTSVLYAFLGVPCIIAVLAKLFRPGLKVVWGVRASRIDLSRYDRLTRIAYRLECFLSPLADLIVFNSNAGKEYAVSNGFSDSKTLVIHNGIDTERFRPHAEARSKIRTEWNVSDDEILIGLVARVDPLKDHRNFLLAASIISKQSNNIRFVCVGDGPEPYMTQLCNLAENSGLADKLKWVGARSDMDSIYNALDILVLSSLTEGFPNVVGEAMACGVPPVVTDAGDSSWVVGNVGMVVPTQDPDQLAIGIGHMLHTICVKGESVKMSARKRICDFFGVETMVSQTAHALHNIVCSKSSSS